jgi:catechol 2,3-dioxygenase-like lactoylglutathione lyase family enzyme
MRIHLTSVYVDDQDKALRFYTEILGFEKKEEFPVGEYRWRRTGLHRQIRTPARETRVLVSANGVSA